MTSPWVPVEPVDEIVHQELVMRTIFDYHKWDPQVGDEWVLAPFPLVIRECEWTTVCGLAETLFAETVAAEMELRTRADLLPKLNLPGGLAKAFMRLSEHDPPRCGARVMRFDFHWSSEGWWISEVNSDVPGGYNETCGLSTLLSPHYPEFQSTGDPVQGLVNAVLDDLPPHGVLALVHATAYSDDRQVMELLGSTLTKLGSDVEIIAPDHLEWRDGRAHLVEPSKGTEIRSIIRFFPGEWLGELPRRAGWQNALAGTETPQSNPPTALLTQTKRFPLVWDALKTALPVWRRLLPETRDPLEVDWQNEKTWDNWILKPALGRMGEEVAMLGVTKPQEWEKLIRQARRKPQKWIVQRRKPSMLWEGTNGVFYPCIGVYVINGRVQGAYGRMARRPLVCKEALDVAVLRCTGESDTWTVKNGGYEH